MKHWLKRHLSQRQYELLRMIVYEGKRWKCRLLSPRNFRTDIKKLHLGSGERLVEGWLNVDLSGTDLNIDIAYGRLPFRDNQFDAIVSQHVAEHLIIRDELIPLLAECHRVLQAGGELWLATPDMEKLAHSYLDYKNRDMIEDRKKRMPDWGLQDMPDQHFMNDIFYQQMEHRNLFDFELLQWTLHQAGFTEVIRTSESALLVRFPEFPVRNDDYQSLYVKAVKHQG